MSDKYNFKEIYNCLFDVLASCIFLIDYFAGRYPCSRKKTGILILIKAFVKTPVSLTVESSISRSGSIEMSHTLDKWEKQTKCNLVTVQSPVLTVPLYSDASTMTR